MPSSELIARARALVAEGRLPNIPATKTFGGHSSGSTCAVCSEAIERGRVEIAISLGADVAGEMVFHPVCHAAWLVALSPNMPGAAT